MTQHEATWPAAEIRDLHVRVTAMRAPYGGDVTALRGLRFTVPEGQVTALVGANGAGKTTALRALVGALPASAGEIDLLGTSMASARSATPREVALVPDAPGYPEHFDAHDVAKLHRAAGPFDARAFGDHLRRHDVPRDEPIRHLSRGQQVSLMVGAALAGRPRLLILDEPFARLDPLARKRLLEGLRQFMAEEGRTVLVSTHDIDGLDRFADRLVVISRGRTVLEGTVESLCDGHVLVGTSEEPAHASRWRRQLVGEEIVGGALTGLLPVDEAVDLPPGADLRRPALAEIITHVLRDADGSRGPRTRRIAP